MYRGLAEAFHWTPEMVRELTMNEITAVSRRSAHDNLPPPPDEETVRRFMANVTTP